MREYAQPWLVAVAVALVVGGAVALVASRRPAVADELDRHWSSDAYEAFQSTAQAHFVESPSLYRWQAKLALEKGDAATAVRALFNASAFDDSVAGRRRLLDDLAVTQESLGLTKTLLDGPFFRFFFVGAEGWSLACFVLAFWTLVGAGFARWYAPVRARMAFAPAVVTAIVLTALGGGGLALERMAPIYGVLLGPGNVPLFRTEAATKNPNDTAGRLAELPPGTLLSLGSGGATGEAYLVVEPFAGWVPRNRTQWLSPGIKN